MVWATLDGLSRLTTVEAVARQRGTESSTLGYRSRQQPRTQEPVTNA
jgi:hypothetical protein